MMPEIGLRDQPHPVVIQNRVRYFTLGMLTCITFFKRIILSRLITGVNALTLTALLEILSTSEFLNPVISQYED